MEMKKTNGKKKEQTTEKKCTFFFLIKNVKVIKNINKLIFKEKNKTKENH